MIALLSNEDGANVVKDLLQKATNGEINILMHEENMYNFTTKEEVDFEHFKELLWNNEFQVVNRELTEEEKAELSREIAKRRAMRQEASASLMPQPHEAVLT